jgi:hypothetical protein
MVDFVRRVVRLSLGTIVVLLGLLLIPLPGPGMMVLIAGLSLLSRDVPAARRLLLRLQARLPAGEDGRVARWVVVCSVLTAALSLSGSVGWMLLS